MVLEAEAFGRYLDHEGGVLMNSISALIKAALQSSLAPSTMWGRSEKSVVCILNEGHYQNLFMVAPWSWTSNSETGFLLFIINLVFDFVIAAWADEDIRYLLEIFFFNFHPKSNWNWYLCNMKGRGQVLLFLCEHWTAPEPSIAKNILPNAVALLPCIKRQYVCFSAEVLQCFSYCSFISNSVSSL